MTVNGHCHHCGKEDRPVFPYTVPAGRFDMCSLCGDMLLRFHKHLGWESPENDANITRSETPVFPIHSEPLHVKSEEAAAEKKPGLNLDKMKARLNRG